MLQDREEIGKDAQCCFCDLSITRWFLTLPGDGQCLFLPWGQERCGSTHGLGREKSFVCKCGFNFSEGISLASTQVPTHAASRPLVHIPAQAGPVGPAGIWCKALAVHVREGLLWIFIMAGNREQAVECPRGPAQPCARGQAGDSLHQRHCESSAKPWPGEILISRKKSLFHLMGQSFPMV